MTDLTPAERRVVLTWRLAVGQRMTTRQVAELLATDCHAAYQVLVAMSRVVPVYYDDPEDEGGPRWQRCDGVAK